MSQRLTVTSSARAMLLRSAATALLVTALLSVAAPRLSFVELRFIDLLLRLTRPGHPDPGG